MWEGEGRLTCADDDTADKEGKRLCTLAGRTREEDRLTPWHVIRPCRSKVVEAVRSMLVMVSLGELQRRNKLRRVGRWMGTK